MEAHDQTRITRDEETVDLEIVDLNEKAIAVHQPPQTE